MYIPKAKGYQSAVRMVAATALAAAILLSGSVPMASGADVLTTLKDQYAALQQQQQQLQSKINSQSSQLESVNQQITQLNASISLTNQQISVLNQQITATDAQLTAKAADIAATQKRVNDNYELYKQRMRAMYEAGNVSYVEVLLASSNINDFLSRSEMLKSISVHDNDLIDSLKADTDRLKQDQTALQADRDNEQQAQGAMAAKQLILQNQQAQQKQLSEQLKAGISSNQQQANNVKQQAQQTDAQINAEMAAEAAARQKQLQAQQAQATPQLNGKMPKSSVSSSSLVKFAQGYVGYPYVWDTHGPDSFDCSGFTSYVYAQAAGIYIPAQSGAQADLGVPVSTDNLQPGDLLFFDTDGGHSNVTHVAIYEGGGSFIGANGGIRNGQSYGSVKEVLNFLSDSYWGSKFLFARRILN